MPHGWARHPPRTTRNPVPAPGRQTATVTRSSTTFSYLQVTKPAGKFPEQNWSHRLGSQSWWDRVQFWVWPCLTFALTYYLVLWGIAVFLLNVSASQLGLYATLSGMMCALLVGYSYFLGTRVFVEMQTQAGISEGLRRCPFVMEILAKTGWVSPAQVPTSSSLASDQAERTS